MKRFLLLLLVLNVSLFIFAEDKIAEYSMSYFSDTAYDIEASAPNKKGKFSFFIYTESKESERHNVCGLQVRSNQVDDLILALRKIEEKYKEWTTTAEQNKVTDFEKCFDIELPYINGFFLYGSKWCFSYGYTFKPWFKVTKNGNSLVYFATSEMTSTDNEFMHYKGLMVAFSSVEEIEKFIQGLDCSKVLNKDAQQKETSDLFK